MRRPPVGDVPIARSSLDTKEIAASAAVHGGSSSTGPRRPLVRAAGPPTSPTGSERGQEGIEAAPSTAASTQRTPMSADPGDATTTTTMALVGERQEGRKPATATQPIGGETPGDHENPKGVAGLAASRVERGASRRSRKNDMGGAEVGLGNPACVDAPTSSAEGEEKPMTGAAPRIHGFGRSPAIGRVAEVAANPMRAVQARAASSGLATSSNAPRANASRIRPWALGRKPDKPPTRRREALKGGTSTERRRGRPKPRSACGV